MIESVRLVGRETGFAEEGQAEAKRLETGFDKIRQVVSKIEEARLREEQHQQQQEPTAENGVAEIAAREGAGEESASGAGHNKQQKVAFLEWLEPLFNGGHWVPDLVRAAGGLYTMAEPGEKDKRSSNLAWRLCVWLFTSFGCLGLRVHDPTDFAFAICGV